MAVVLASEIALRSLLQNFPDSWRGCCRVDGPECTIRMLTTGPAVAGEVWIHDDLLGHRLRPNLGRTMFDSAWVTSGNTGTRGPRSYSYVKPVGTTRMVAVGDSFTFGQEVDDDQTWPAVLEQLAESREVINLGASAYGQDQALLALREEGLKYSPDIVLFGYYTADTKRNLVRWFCAPKPVFRRSGESFRLSNVPVPSAEAEIARARQSSLALALTQVSLAELWSRFVPPAPEGDDLEAFLLSEMASTAARAGSRFVVVRLPDEYEVAEPAARMPPGFAAYCGREGALCVDTGPALNAFYSAEQGQRSALFRRNHYTPAANRVVALDVERVLRSLERTAHSP